MSKFKHCPFCGGAPDLRHKPGDWGYTQATISVGCEKCGVRFVEAAEKWVQGKGTFSIRDEAEARITERWNRRDAPPKKPTEKTTDISDG